MQITPLSLWLYFVSLTGAKFTNGWCRSIHGSISLRQSLESLAFWSTRRGLIPSSKFSLHRWAEVEFYFLSVLILVAAGWCYNSDLFLIFKKDNTNKSLNTCNCLHYFIYFFSFFSFCLLSCSSPGALLRVSKLGLHIRIVLKNHTNVTNHKML